MVDEGRWIQIETGAQEPESLKQATLAISSPTDCETQNNQVSRTSQFAAEFADARTYLNQYKESFDYYVNNSLEDTNKGQMVLSTYIIANAMVTKEAEIYQLSHKDRSIDNTQICAQPPVGAPLVDVCQGDSGGPIFSTDLGEPTLVSYGPGCALPQAHGVYTNVKTFTPWINEILSKNAAERPASSSSKKKGGSFGGMEFLLVGLAAMGLIRRRREF